MAKNLKGKLLLAHGTLDDNVPPYNTELVVEALIKANKDFDQLMLTNQRHGYAAMSNYMMRRRWDYFVKWLINAEPPKEYEIRTPEPRGGPPAPVGGRQAPEEGREPAAGPGRRAAGAGRGLQASAILHDPQVERVMEQDERRGRPHLTVNRSTEIGRPWIWQMAR